MKKMKVMRTSAIWLLSSAMALSAWAQTDKATWTCTAKGLVKAQYSGGDWAMVHLEKYTSGGSYRVTKNADGTEASGNTKDGTPFVCVKTADKPQ